MNKLIAPMIALSLLFGLFVTFGTIFITRDYSDVIRCSLPVPNSSALQKVEFHQKEHGFPFSYKFDELTAPPCASRLIPSGNTILPDKLFAKPFVEDVVIWSVVGFAVLYILRLAVVGFRSEHE